MTPRKAPSPPPPQESSDTLRDQTDRDLITLLQANARESSANLARKLGIARTTVVARLARLASLRGWRPHHRLLARLASLQRRRHTRDGRVGHRLVATHVGGPTIRSRIPLDRGPDPARWRGDFASASTGSGGGSDDTIADAADPASTGPEPTPAGRGQADRAEVMRSSSVA